VAPSKKTKSNLFDPIESPLYGTASSTGGIELAAMPLRDLSRALFNPPCAACQFPLPFRLRLMSSVLFRVPIAGHPTAVIVREVPQTTFDQRTLIAKVEGTELEKDRTGIIAYSDVEVQFRYDLLRSEAVATLVGVGAAQEAAPFTIERLQSLYSDIKKVSLFVVNRLLKIYRVLSGEYHVRPIVPGDIFYTQTGWLFPGAPIPMEMTWEPPGGGIVPQSHPFSPAFHDELGRWLAAETDVPIWLELVQDAREHLELGRFRHVVIDTRTALEVYTDQTLLACFKQRGLSPRAAAIEMKLSTRRAQSLGSLEDAIRLARINDKLKYGLRRALGLELSRRKVWNKWLIAKDMREGSVHYGEDVPEEQARLCLGVTETLINLIHDAGSPVSASLKP
jgi:hypothetical protein